jgi:hypothetical protein
MHVLLKSIETDAMAADKGKVFFDFLYFLTANIMGFGDRRKITPIFAIKDFD